VFDIDGTLTRSRDRVHFTSFARSVAEVTGIELSLAGVSLHGNTDTGILREAWRLAGLADAALDAQEAAIQAGMCRYVADHRGEMELAIMAGVPAVLEYLAERGALLGLGTGNLEEVGWTKMEQAGLRKWFRFGGFSDRFPMRSELIGDAARQARELAGAEARVCVVGDTPRDIEAARANSLPVIAVATGNFSFEALLELEPEVCATSLADLMALTRSAP